MTTWQAMSALESSGVQFVLQDREIRYQVGGCELTDNERELLSIVRQDRAAAADFIRARNAGATVVDDESLYSVPEALAIAKAIDRGEARLLGKVVYHMRDNACTVRWMPTTDEAPAVVLARSLARMKAALQAKLDEMDASEFWKLPPEELDAMCDRYGQYCRMLEGC